MSNGQHAEAQLVPGDGGVLRPSPAEGLSVAETFDVYDWAVSQVERTAARLHAEGGRTFPHVTDGGRWRTWPADVYAGWDGDRWSHGNWTCGFWVGLLWLAYLRTGEARFERWARAFGELVAPRQDDQNTHDLGFVFYPSFALGHWITGDESLKAPAVRAARTLLKRFNPQGRYLQAWGPLDHPLARRSTAIDTMMNLPLLWWAARVTGEPAFAEAARAHAATSATHYLRPDGSTYHTFTFDPDTGTPLGGGTYQGASADSAWSRGVAWGLYGWALAYREHRDPTFLSAAMRAAAYFLRALPPDLVPPWDFADADPAAPRDSSASAICANALLELGQVHPDAAQRQHFTAHGRAMLEALCRGYLARGTGEDGLLGHAVYSKPHQDAVDSAVIWGDWFFLRALAHLTIGPVPLP
ncbi:MAG: glycoside hydrolase family 88 protein [Chloroflexota bacterium]